MKITAKISIVFIRINFVLCSLYVNIILLNPMTLGSKHYFHLHFSDEDVKSQTPGGWWSGYELFA